MKLAKPLIEVPRSADRSADMPTTVPADMDVEGNIRELTRGSSAIRQAEAGDGTASSLSSLLGRVAGSSTREIDKLIGELQTLRQRLETDAHRIQHDIVEYAGLSQQVMQLTKIISDSVKKLPDISSMGELRNSD